MTHHSRAVDTSALVGLVAGMGLLLSACLAPELRGLAAPAFLLLMPSLIHCMR
jgi:hypothetical protein